MSAKSVVRVHRYAKDQTGCRAAQFDWPGSDNAVKCVVSSYLAEDNDLVLKAAHSLFDHATTIAALDDEVKTLRDRLARAELDLEHAKAALAVAKSDVPRRLLGEGTVRFIDGRPHLLSKRETGWSAFALVFDSWDELFRRWDVRVTGHGQDETGPYWTVTNGAAS